MEMRLSCRRVEKKKDSWRRKEGRKEEEERRTDERRGASKQWRDADTDRRDAGVM